MSSTIDLRIGNTSTIHFYSKKHQAKNPVVIDLGKPHLNRNLQKLICRKKGEHFSNSDAAIRRVVTETLRGIETYLATREEEKPLSDLEKKIWHTIFFRSSLTRLPQRLYERSTILDGGALEKILRPELSDKRALFAKTVSKEEPDSWEIGDVAKDFRIAEASFARKLGYELKKKGGSGGSRRSFSRLNKPLEINKPNDEGPDQAQNPKWYARIKSWIIAPRACTAGNSQASAEVDSYLLSSFLGIDIVPPTQLRLLKSRDFNGDRVKECSTQSFVEAEYTLAEYVGLPSFSYIRSRASLQEYFEKNKIILQNKIPAELLERLAVHCSLVEDTDAHLENILVIVRESKSQADLLVERILTRKASEKEQKDFVQNFFRKDYNQALLRASLFSAQNEQKEWITLVKIDGGASNPHSHPTGYLEQRFTHFFEVLPHFEKPFSKKLDLVCEQKFKEFLEAKAIEGLQSYLEPAPFNIFWANQENLILFKNWIFAASGSDEIFYRQDLCTQIWEAQRKYFLDMQGWPEVDRISILLTEKKFKSNCIKHLVRLHHNLRARRESWLVLKSYMEDAMPMRAFLRGVRCEKDFRRELERIEGKKEQNSKSEIEVPMDKTNQGEPVKEEEEEEAMTGERTPQSNPKNVSSIRELIHEIDSQ